MEPKYYACINMSDTRNKCSSGGIYPLICERVLKNHGIVFAAVYDEGLKVIHRRVESELESSYGSKYSASDLSDTYKAIISELEKGEYVLFVGTPCQCGGLISYLSLRPDAASLRKNLILIDFVCHGVPSPSVWRSYLRSMENSGHKITSVNMRDKTSGWSHYLYSWKLQDDTGWEIFQPQGQNPYMKGFISNLYLRPSCFHCRFKGIERQTDITLGDYWGVWDLEPEMDDNKGTSLVMIHTKEGENIFKEISGCLLYRNANIEKAAVYNPCITSSAIYNKKRRMFYEQEKEGADFQDNIDMTLSISIGEKMKDIIKTIIRRFLSLIRVMPYN